MTNKETPTDNMDEKIASFLIIFLMLFSGLGEVAHILSYSKYLVFPLAMILIIRNSIVWDGCSSPFLLLLLSGILHFWSITQDGLKDIFFISTYVIPFLIIKKQYLDSKMLFIGVMFIYLITIPFSWKGSYEFSLLDSKSSLESHTFAFVFGLFSIHFFLTKQKIYLIIALVMSILVLKRISLIAIILIYTLTFLPERIKTNILSKWFLVLANLIYLAGCVFISTPEFNSISQEYFGVSSSYLTMGRSILYGEIFSTFDFSLFSWGFGNGIGSAYDALQFVSWVDKLHLHNDVLRIFYEHGLIVLVLFFVLLYSGKRDIKIMGLYINIVMLTDNIIVYAFVMFIFLYLCRESIEHENNSNA